MGRRRGIPGSGDPVHMAASSFLTGNCKPVLIWQPFCLLALQFLTLASDYAREGMLMIVFYIRPGPFQESGQAKQICNLRTGQAA